jgi:hypothetical protein
MGFLRCGLAAGLLFGGLSLLGCGGETPPKPNLVVVLGTLFNELIRIPLLGVVPGQTRPEVVDDVVSLVDVAPTLVELAGGKSPPSFEGSSLRAHLGGRRRWWDVTRAFRTRPAASPALSELIVP